MMSREIAATELEGLDSDRYMLIDIRDSLAFEYGHIDGAVNIPQEELMTAELPRDKS